MEGDDQKLLMASDAGYGFVCTFNDLVARNRAGKALITLPENAHVMPPLVIEDEHDMLLAITQAGRMLMFPVDSLPQLSKGKGIRLLISPLRKRRKADDGTGAPVRAAATKHSDYPCREAQIKLRPEELQKGGRRTRTPWHINARPAAYRSH
ncbi:DNA topoisomerase 4 subunit A [Salmonella enterica subsp. enterica]|uniref:DNA topoisomerase 4 subunit A n=1 Tax=Salmonella enterica I TaxID=59201 RepID=A0A447N3T4_SALET|nr:DNA topoisomerase 4 subunit A [Salmonella enterica subsp. enterica]